MENFRQEMATVMKTEKKDMLLSSKDPHLSHLFEHGGPNTPHSMSTDNIAQPNIDVDGNYPEEPNEQEYSLFQEQGPPFMPAFTAESSHLVMGVSCADGSVRNRCVPNDENNNGCGEKAKMVVSGNHQQISGMKKADIQQSLRPPNLLIASANVQGETRDGDKPHILSPPADHYNMQLLAHSAQQQQQLLQQQRQQQEMFGQGSSSAALQQLAKLHQQKEQNIELMEDQSFVAKSAGFPLYVQGDSIQVDSSGKPVQMPVINASNQPNVVLPYSSAMQPPSKHIPALISNYQGWPVGERATPDFEKGHVRDLSFGSQDSPVYALQMADIVKNSGGAKTLVPTLYPKHASSVLPPVSTYEREPELKSPLDHPDQLERHRGRFFSSDSGPASGGEQQPPDDDEAPLNEHDKKAAAAISKLMEQSEKNPPPNLPQPSSFKINNMIIQDHNFVRPNNPNSSLPLNILQMQELFRNTPPPTYEQSLLPTVLPPGLVASVPSSAALAMANHEVKQEPNSPAKPSRQHYISGEEHYKFPQNCGQVSMPEDHSKFLPGGNIDIASRNCVAQVGNPPLTANLPVSVPYAPMQQTTSNTEKSVSTLQSKPAPRTRRTSSSGSNRRKSDGNLTCGLCGNSFRSTPALNGHMRVHSTPEKKQNKEERQARSSNESAPKSSPLIKPSISPHSQQYYDPGKLQQVPVQQDASANPDGSLRLIPYQYQTDTLDPSLQNRSHNGLLTMASAACFLKTEASKADYPNTVLPSAYIVPHPVLFQQPTVVPSSYHVDVMNPNFTDNQPAANPFQQGLPFSNISFFTNMPHQPVLQQDTGYPNNQPQIQMMPAVERGDNLSINSQNYVNQSEKPMIMVGGPEDNFPGQYAPPPNPGTNSLSQLASIAVAAATANREYDPNSNMPPDMSANYPANDMQPANTEPGGADNVALMQSNIGAGIQQDGLGQEEVFQGSNIAAETSPMQSSHDPFIFPVSGPNSNQQRNHYGNYNSISNTVTGNREPMVTWKDNVDTRSYSLLSSYDDPLMQEAVNVANPSKILPNSMMGGTPPAGSILSGARPFRQRHHSEGAHLIKNSESSILKRILDSPAAADMPVTNERLCENERQDLINVQLPPDGLQTVDMYAANNVDKNLMQVPSDASETKKVEFWAEPKPIQRRIRRRRHSADSRLFLKPGPLPNRMVHHVGNPVKKATGLRKGRDRRRPPPLVIPSSVNTFTSGTHPNLYTSHLHHRRRPSGDSTSSITGLNDKIPPYTPPPMLSPIRAGSGLYCTTPVTPMTMFNRQKSIEAGISTIVEEDESAEEEDEELVRSCEPKINIGSRFQANIPNRRPRESLTACKHKADKVWAPKKMDKNDIFKHVEQFMELSCSAVVPFGGANKEYAIDCIAQSNGDILSAVRRLISRKNDGILSNKKLKNYTGSGKPWTSQEAQLFERAMLENRKDFSTISKMVKTRSAAECVERYYHVVKRNRRRSRLPRRYRDHESDEFATLLADIDEKKFAHSSPSASSSDDESSKNKVSSDSDLASWLPPDHQSKSDSSQSSSYYSHSSPSHMASHQAFPKPIKTHTARIQHGRKDSPSPVGSPASNLSNDDQPTQMFTCPVCGKSFAKVKSRNAHMKTHGKQAQEKRRQREEEAARRREEMANRQHNASHQRHVAPPMHQTNFIHPSSVNAGKLYPHPQHPSLQQTHPDMVVSRYSASM